MADSLTITRVWQDSCIYEVEIKCETEHITARGKVYTDDVLIDDLHNIIESFLEGKADIISWQNSTRGDMSTPCVSFKFSHKDKLGHVQIEVFMEIDDGGTLDKHNCCFYVNTEIGLLYQFKEKLLKLKQPQIGIQVFL